MITYGKESLRQGRSCLESLFPEQYAHTGDAALPINPMWDFYAELEKHDRFALFMARRDDRAIGYAAAILHLHVNSKDVLVGSIPTYFAEECSIRPFILRGLIANSSDWLVMRGAKEVTVDTEYQHSAGRLLQRMGFIPCRIGYRLSTKEQGHA